MKKRIFIILGIFIAIVLLVIGSLYVFSPETLTTITGTCIGGLNILISRASHLPGQEFFKGEATATLGGECLKIAWTEQDVESYLAEGGNADRGVYGDIIINSQSNTFNTYERTYEKIYYPRIKNVGTHAFKTCSVSNCQKWLTEEGVTYDLVYGGRRIVPLVSDCYCYYATEWGRFAPITGTGKYDFDATISIDGLGSQDISSTSRSVSFGDKVTFQWMGSLLGANFVTTPPYTPFREWGVLKLTSTNYGSLKGTTVVFKGYTSTLENYIKTCISIFSHPSSVNECVADYKSKVSDLIKDRKSEYIASSPLIVGAKFEGNDFVVGIEPYQTRFERFSFDIDATWLGIEYVTGVPKVSCPGTQEIFSAEKREATFEVTNVGDGSGVFGLYLTCGRLSTDVTPDSVSLISGGSTIVNGELTGTFFQDETISCEFKAVAKKDVTKVSRCYFDVKGKPRAECLPGEKKCSGDKATLLLCKDTGMWQTQAEGKECVDGCIYVGDTAKCVEMGECAEENEVCKDDYECCTGLECRNNLCKPVKPGWQWDNLYFIPILLAVGLSSLMGWKSKEKTGKYQAMSFIIWGVLGAIIGFVAMLIIKNWLMITLITLFGGGLSIGLVLFLGGMPLLIFIINLITKRR